MEGDDGAGVGCLSCDSHLRGRLSLGIFLDEHLAFPVDFSPEIVRKGVDAGHADSVQTSGHLVAVLAELSACMEHREHHLKGGTVFLLMHSGRDTAAVVLHGYGIVFIDADFDVSAISRKGLVYTVVNHLIYKMVQTSLPYVADIH